MVLSPAREQDNTVGPWNGPPFMGVVHGCRVVSTWAIAGPGEYDDVMGGRELSGVKKSLASPEAGGSIVGARGKQIGCLLFCVLRDSE